MSITIGSVHALEVLDSRARPTLAVGLTLSDGTSVRVGVPSGASTGSGEAVELRERDPERYNGQGRAGGGEECERTHRRSRERAHFRPPH